MKIKTLFFGITSDLVNASELEIEVDENSSVENFKSILKDEFSSLEKINSYAIAVNEEYAENETLLKVGDVVAVIPPVSGG
ncbi:molybdopterin synthase sulfur carrier subunit [Polaribacter reichenbachii]|uniref:Molybdopterin synthase sulfur carrier subunit n=1 Tax=Polaribacter reichenbachii TaxID=996801 RepID=A0A1B8U7G5_9FLAO|nr:MoaD/ThiS family protein [Polaribacter reichenbachii]APZ46444.1 molybdopterin synthase sulfur carrier subunit [Polaribacter reichenbachii]AUC20309.1 molybdopterin synthase sulfur carrier subunit [Polaribacter reichenbachii]OBY67790.1 molybdopterin synthase sulfur carrier subunit [Polaribacter reichenbachii]